MTQREFDALIDYIDAAIAASEVKNSCGPDVSRIRQEKANSLLFLKIVMDKK